VPRKTWATHREGVIENDELVALSAFGGDVPAFQGSAVIRWEVDVAPSRHPIVVRGLVKHAAERLDDGGEGLDLGVILCGNGLELGETPFRRA
jgi:hypothetical protein